MANNKYIQKRIEEVERDIERDQMTNGQIAKFQELGKCYIERKWSRWYDRDFVSRFTTYFDERDIELYKFGKLEKAWLRRLHHQYRNQILAIRRNQKKLNEIK